MWLTIQIAAGIVLAYVIIRNGAAVWKYSLGLLALVTVVATLFIVGTFANQAVSSYGGLGAIVAKGLRLVGWLVAMVMYVSAIVGQGYAVREVWNSLFRRQWHSDGAGIFFAGVMHFFIIGLALQGFDLTDEGPILGPIDAYSRSVGLGDGLTVAFWLFASLWIIPLGLWLRRRRRARTTALVVSEADKPNAS